MVALGVLALTVSCYQLARWSMWRGASTATGTLVTIDGTQKGITASRGSGYQVLHYTFPAGGGGKVAASESVMFGNGGHYAGEAILVYYDARASGSSTTATGLTSRYKLAMWMLFCCVIMLVGGFLTLGFAPRPDDDD